MKRYEIINYLIHKHGYKTYLEIGVQNHVCFDNVNIKSKICVDPDPNAKADFVMTSDEFFAQTSKGVTWDIVFIDGLHPHEQSLKDVMNALDFISENGTIVMHDCNPQKEIEQRVPRETKRWNGDVWKTLVTLMQSMDDLEIFTVDTDEGCGVIRKSSKRRHLLDITDNYLTYENLNKHRKQWLNLISTNEFLELMGDKQAIKKNNFRIWEFIPYSFDLDYGDACNKYFELVPNDDDWVAIRDTDILSLTPAHMHKIRETIIKHPDTGLFTCLTNRVKQNSQIADMSLFDNTDIKVHRELALKLEKAPIDAPIINYVISGYLMIMKKSTWKKIGGFPSGTLGVDNKVSYRVRQAGMDVRIMRNVYFFHYYRWLEGINWRGHLKK